jgi:hypothetical protein
MEQETGRFRAISDDGQEFVVIEYQPICETRTLSGTSITKGLKRLVLSDGSSVNQIDPETFKIVQTHQIIRKIR